MIYLKKPDTPLKRENILRVALAAKQMRQGAWQRICENGGHDPNEGQKTFLLALDYIVSLCMCNPRVTGDGIIDHINNLAKYPKYIKIRNALVDWMASRFALEKEERL